MAYTKIYLKHEIFRRGSPVLAYVTKDTDSEKNLYCLGVYHDIIPFKHLQRGVKNLKHYKGIGQEYHACQKSSISKELYDAFVKEAKANQKTVDEIQAYRKKHYRKCRSCGCEKHIGKPCEICTAGKQMYEKEFNKSSKGLSMKKILKSLSAFGLYPYLRRKKNG